MYLFWYIPFIIYNIMNDKVKYGSNFLDYKKVEDEFTTHLSKWLEWEDIAPERQQNIRKVASSFLQSWKQNGVMDPIAQTYTGNLDGNSEDISEVLRFVSEAISGRGIDYFKYQEPEKPKEEEKSIAQINYEKALENQKKQQEEITESLKFKEKLFKLGTEVNDLVEKYKKQEDPPKDPKEQKPNDATPTEEEIKKIEKHFSNNIKLSELDKYDFTESDKKRLFSLFLDVVSIIDPEPITAGGLGLYSDYLTLQADRLDGINDSYWDDVVNAGLSIFGAIPVAGDLGMIGKLISKIPKSLKTLTGLASIPAIGITLDQSDELKETWNKIFEGGKNLTVEDARNMYTILTLGLGVGNAAKSMHSKFKANKLKNTEGVNTLQISGTKNGKKETLSFTGDDIDLIKSGTIPEVKTFIETKNPGFTIDINKSRNFTKDKFWKIPYPKLQTTEYIPYKEIKSGYSIPSTSEAWKSGKRHQFFLRKQGGILKAQNGTPLWFTNRYKSKSLKGWNSNLNKELWKSGGFRGKADSLDQPWETNYAYSQDTTALQNDLSNYYKNSTLDEQKALEEYNSNVNKLNNFWGNTDVYYNQTVDINPIFAKLYTSRHSSNPNYGLGYQQNLDTMLGSTTWNRRALAYENNQNQAFDFGARKVAFNKDGTIRFVDQSVPEVQNPEELQNPETQNVKTHSYSNKNKDEEIPELEKAPKRNIIIGEILAKLGQYTNSSIYNNRIFDTLNKTPLYQMLMPSNVAKKIYGNQRAIEETQKAKGELKSEASKAKTSDANLEAARQFQANYQGNQYLAQGFKEDDAMYRKTEAERQQQDEKNAMLNWQTVNQNLKYLNDWQQGKIKAKVNYLASQRESRDNLLKALETIYMNNKYDKQSRQEAAYNEYIKNYALRYPSATGLKEADVDILRKTTRTDQEERYYQEYILPTLQSWIQSQKYGKVYPNLPINKPGYYDIQ